jgi:SAM-dependent methyltransferase
MRVADPLVLYSGEFFSGLIEGASRSAAQVVPLVLSLVPAKTIIDVGCGLGAWAAAFVAHNVPEVWGLDGGYIDRSQLQIRQDRFLAHDLTVPIQLDQVFDLAVCLEVAEHLPGSRADGLISDLTSLAPCVLFSAAVPGQPGTNHINAQYLPYWVTLFGKYNYQGIDPIRPRILGNDAVDWWYQQNIVIFVRERHPLLAAGFPTPPQTIIHQRLYEHAKQPPTLGAITRALPGAVVRSLRHRFGIMR